MRIEIEELQRLQMFINEEIELKKRDDVYKWRRYYLMKYIREKYSISLASIGAMFGKDHSTVVNALKQVNLLEPYEDYKQAVNDLIYMFPMNSRAKQERSIHIIDSLVTLENRFKQMVK